MCPQERGDKHTLPTQQPSRPPEVDLSSSLSSARDQGQRGTCTAFATTALHEIEKTAGASASLALSEEVLYWGAKQADKNYSSGTSFRSVHLALGRWGQPESALWPYDPARNDGDASYAPPAEAINPVNCHRGRLEAVALDVTAVQAHLAGGRAVAAAFQMSTGFFRTVDGKVPVPQPHELLAEHHSVLLTGYRDQSGVFRFRNSWGTSWGAGGYSELPYDYFTRHGKSAYIFHVGT